MKTLNVKKIAKSNLESKWGFKLPAKFNKFVFIRCNAKGVVNYDKAPVYDAVELVDRGNFVVHN